MSSAKQVTACEIGVYAYNGGYRAFEGYPIDLPTWNVDGMVVPEWFEGSPHTRALSGYLRANSLSYRPKIRLDLDNSLPATATIIRNLLNKISSKYTQTFYAVTSSGSAIGGTALTLTSGAPAVDDYFNGMIISGLTGGDVIVTDYVGSTRIATLAQARTWTNALALTVKVQPNLPIVIGCSIDDSSDDLLYYTIEDASFGILREMTIGRQRATISLLGVNDVQDIPDGFRIA
jgi:hypothetical protein